MPISKKVDLNSELTAQLEILEAMPDKDIDISDIPATTADDWADAKRGVFYRPMKQQLTLRIDADLIAWFKTHSPDGGYQTKINQALRLYVDELERKKAG